VTRGSGDRPAGRERYALIAAAFNEMVVRSLLEGALACFRAHGVEDDRLEVSWVPGAFELPLAAKVAAETGRFDAVVCLGAVIRGETAHFDLIAGEAARGIREAGMETGVPVLFGVLTTDTVQQALDRAGGAHGNKGWDAALAAAQMVKVLDELRSGDPEPTSSTREPTSSTREPTRSGGS
jgi:6,7-dimethyl-8-ribityllumazine synthase